MMRYDCADAYIPPGRPRDRIKPTGMKLCRSSKGEGVNVPGSTPPRYSNAVMGDRTHKFAVRDDVPALSPWDQAK